MIVRQLEDGPARKLVGIRPEGRAPARDGAEILSADGRSVGRVTSGGFGPTVGGPVALGYVAADHAAVGTPLQLVIRGKPHAAQVAALPFVPTATSADGVRAMSDTRYTKEHEWVRLEGDAATLGISEHAQEQLGDVVFVDLPEVGRKVSQGAPYAVVESVKAASDVYAPVSGEVMEVNQALEGDPGLVNRSAEGEGWFCKLRVSDSSEVAALMDAAAYQTYVASQS